MPSITTVFRAVVMIATGVVAVKGWQLYGPPTEKVKALAVTALEKAQTAWNGTTETSANPAAMPNDPRSLAPPNVAVAPPPTILPAAVTSAPQLVPLPSGVPNPPAELGAVAPSALAASSTVTPAEDPIAKLLTQLDQLGAPGAQVTPWGSSGQLYRCCCRARLAEASPLVRHFEAVAGEPTVAVEQVVAKVAAWRTEQQNLLR